MKKRFIIVDLEVIISRQKNKQARETEIQTFHSITSFNHFLLHFLHSLILILNFFNTSLTHPINQ